MQKSSAFAMVENYITELQHQICQGLEQVEEEKFQSDTWQRPEGGGGCSNIIQNGTVFEKAGVNISSVHGQLPVAIAEKLKVKPGEFAACGLSLVLHPGSPRIPTTHMNVRYFELADGDSWFGGGIDLTPYYPEPGDFRQFHQVLKEACDQVDRSFYPEFKKQCDDYFTIAHRGEMRGIGGIFYDYLRSDFDRYFSLTRSVGDSFLPAYLPMVEKHKNSPFTEEDKKFQLVRRGRYVEFNLVYDRGTLFGLKTNGRVESILMSLPPQVEFLYNWQPPENSIHHKMLAYYQPTPYIENE